MKKFLLGVALFMTGGLSCVILLAGAMQGMALGYATIFSIWQVLNQYRLLPLMGAMAFAMLMGLIIAVREMLKGE